jgi:2'-5' RNA ligase
MRLFIGIPLPEGVKKLLVSIYDLFNSVPEKLKFVPYDNLHITLLFIGEVPDEKPIIDSLSKVSFNSFNASIENFSVFPNAKFIRVIHSPATKGSKELKDLHNSLRKVLEIKPDFSFVPHATIARVKEKCNPLNILSIIKNITFNEEFKVTQFNLYKSILTSKGPIYEVLGEFKAKDLK